MAAPAIVRADALMAIPRRPWPPFLLRADGRLVCNGALLRAQDFPELYSVIGTSFGGTDSTFRLPEVPPYGQFEYPYGQFEYLVNTAPLPNGPVGTLALVLSR